MKHGIFRVAPRYPKGEQIEALSAAGVRDTHIFDWRDRADHLRTFRKGDTLCVNGLDRLGEDWGSMIALLETLSAKGVFVLNVESGRLADAGATADIVVASRRLIGERRRLSDPQYKAMGAKRKGKRLVTWAISDAAAAKVWRDRGIATNDEAAATITEMNKAEGGREITVPMLQKRFGGSGRPAGWRRGQKRET